LLLQNSVWILIKHKNYTSSFAGMQYNSSILSTFWAHESKPQFALFLWPYFLRPFLLMKPASWLELYLFYARTAELYNDIINKIRFLLLGYKPQPVHVLRIFRNCGEQVNPGSFDTAVPQHICQSNDVFAGFVKYSGKKMP